MPPTIIKSGFHATLYENPRPIIWTWPVHVSLIKADPVFVEQLKSAHWTERFAIFHNDEEPAQFGIVLEPKGFSTFYDLFYANYQFENTGVAIIFEDDNFFANEIPSDDLKQKVQEVAHTMKFSGVLIISRPVDPVGWLNYLFENLAHNLNIIEVIQMTAKRGYLFYDAKVEEETKLISVLQGIAAGMDPMFFNPDEPLQFYSRITGNTQMKPAELKSFIVEAIRQLRFDHESEGATMLAEMTQGLYEHYGELRLNTHVKNFMLYQSPPPDEVGADEPNETAARYLHAKICNKTDVEKINLPQLSPETDYDAFIKISVPDVTWTSSNSPVNQEMIFGHSQKEEEDLTVQWITDVNEPVQSQLLKLPRKGNSEEIKFTLTTKNKKDAFVAKIFIYHRVRLIQVAELKSAIASNSNLINQITTTLTVLFSAASDSESLEKSKAFVRSFHLNSNENGIALLDTGNEKYALPNNPQLMNLVNRIRVDIENAAKNTEKHPPDLNDEENIALLRRLAIKGNDLAENYLRHDVQQGPIQIVTQQQEFVPLDYVYILPPPESTATLCDHAADALRKGSCMNCHDFSKSPAPFICPFGFWGLSRVIERYRYEGTTASANTQFASFYVGQNGQPMELPVLQNSLHASTIKTEKYEPGLRSSVFKTIESNSKQSIWAHSWPEWEQHVQSHHPESLLLIVHTEIEPNLDAVQMEIEDAKFLVKNYLNEKMISNDQAIKPIVIVLGCSTSDLQDQTFDISSQFLNHGAQYVISNFTKIRGQQAGRIMIKLVAFMKEQTQQRSTLGETMLRLRQHLLADGIMVSLAMIAHGDALQLVKS